MALHPPDDLPPDLCCKVHAACRGDADALQQVLDGRARLLDRIGQQLGLAVQPPTPVAPARIRIRLRPGDDGRLGFSLPRSHTHQPIGWCGLAHPRINQVLPVLPPMPGGMGSAELRTDGSRVVLAARSRKPRFRKQLVADLRRLDLTAPTDAGGAGLDGVAVDGRTVAGDPSITLTLGGRTHQLSPETFTQVQLDTNDALVAAVAAAVQRLGGTALLDLYAGCGNLGLSLLGGDVQALTMIESSPDACADARRTAAAHRLTVDIRKGDASAFQAGDAFFDLALLDPPRSGAPGVLEQVCLTRPKGVVFVCCNPHLLARDLRPALDAGYRLEQLAAFDMFPLTEHVELLAVLAR